MTTDDNDDEPLVDDRPAAETQPMDAVGKDETFTPAASPGPESAKPIQDDDAGPSSPPVASVPVESPVSQGADNDAEPLEDKPPSSPRGLTPPRPGAAQGTQASAKWCPQCSQEAAPEHQFCGKCGLSFECPGCTRRDYLVGNRYCTSCGVSPVKYRQFQECEASGKRLLQNAQDQVCPDKRLELLDQADRAFSEALQRYPEEKKVQAIVHEWRRHVTVLLWEMCAAARRDRQFSRALSLLQRVAQDASQSSRAIAAIQELMAQREGKIAEAAREADGGRWERAVQLLAELQRGFPDVPEIKTLLADCQHKRAAIEEVAKKVPQLEQEKKLVALLQLHADLDRRQLHFSWPAGAIEKAREKLKWADGFADRSEQLLNARQPGEALMDVKRALDLVADHTKARQVQEVIEQAKLLRQGWEKQFNEAIEAQRWFLADLARAQLIKSGTGGLDRDKLALIELGVKRANEFRRFIAWVFFGCVLLFLGARMALTIEGRLAGRMPQQFFGLALITAEVAQRATMIMFLGALTFLLLIFLRACFAYPSPFSAVARGFGMVIVTTGLGGLLWSLLFYKLYADSSSIVAAAAYLSGSLVVMAGLGAVLASISTLPSSVNRNRRGGQQ